MNKDDKQNQSDSENDEDKEPANPYKAAMDAAEKEDKKVEDDSEANGGKSEDDSGNSDEEKQKGSEAEDKQSQKDEDKAPEDKEKGSGSDDEKSDKKDGDGDEELSPAAQEKIDKANKHAQDNIKMSTEKLFAAEKRLVEKDPERLIELANSKDDKEVKLARRLSKEVYDGLSLDDALNEIRKSRKENGDEEEKPEELKKRIEQTERRKARNEFAQKSFYEKNPILDSDSEEFDKDVKEEFDKKFARLGGDEGMLEEELKDALGDAFDLATRGLEKKVEKKDASEAQKKIGSAGNGKSDKADGKTDDNPYAGLKKSV